MKFTVLNLLSLVVIVALSVALIALMMKRDRVVTLRSSATDNFWRLRETFAEGMPAWDQQQPNPPLPIGNALAIADKIREELETVSTPLGIGSWELETLTLSPLDFVHGGYTIKRQRWCYLATFYG
jgi:hypothetical protein